MPLHHRSPPSICQIVGASLTTTFAAMDDSTSLRLCRNACTELEIDRRLKDANGAEGDRTLNLRIANAALSQLSYRPIKVIDLKVPSRIAKRKVR